MELLPWRREGWGETVSIHTKTRQKAEPGFFSAAQRQERGNRHKVKHGTFCPNLSKQFFTARVITEHWHGVSILEIFKSQLDIALGNAV